MHSSLPLILGAGLGVGFADPFNPGRLCAARRHPRRDPEGHPNGDNQQPKPNDGSGDPQPKPTESDWATAFEGLTPAQVKEKLDNSRKWEDRAKGNFTKLQQFDAIAKVLTGDSETPPDPQKLAADLSASQQATRDTQIENAVLRTAGAQGAALVDSRSFMAKVSAFDLSDPTEFIQQVKDAIAAHLKDNPAPSSGGTSSDPYLRHPSSNTTSSRDLGSAEADRRFGIKT